MSTLLYRVGRWTYRHPFRVIGVWAALLVALVGALILNPPKLSTEFRIDGTPAQEVIDELARELPEVSGGQGSLVFQAPAGDRLDSERLGPVLAEAVQGVYSVEEVVDPAELMQAQQQPGAAPATPPGSTPGAPGNPPSAPPGTLVVGGQPVLGVTVSEDGRVALFQFQFDDQIFELPQGTVADTVAAAEAPAEEAGVAVLPGATLQEIPEIIGVGEIVGLAVAALVLVVTLGSVVAAGLPLLTALAGVGAGIGGAFALAHLFELNSLSVVLALMLGLAVGIDYALFIVNRQRWLILTRGLDAGEATGRAVGTAGSAVFFAGTTVVIALTALLVVGISLLTVMALIAAATVAIAVLVALTLLPALLGLVKERICSPRARARQAGHRDRSRNPARRWVGLVVRYRWAAVVLVTAFAALLALPLSSMRLGMPSAESYGSGTPQREGYDLVAEGFGEGFNGPLVVAARTAEPGTPIEPPALQELVADLSGIDGVQSAVPAGLSQDGTIAVLQVVPTTGPTDEATEDLVAEIRDRSAQYGDDLGITLGVTGLTAIGIDMSQRLSEVLPIYLAVVLGLSLIVLLLVFRSILVPVKATLGFLLSILATFGATTAVFQWGWLNQVFGLDSTTVVMSVIPIIATGVLYGLAMDYQIFLVSSIRESHVHGHHGTDSVTDGFSQASRVVVAAAIIMTAVFGGFIFNADPMVKQVGFALAVGILIDAFLIRLTLVPAVMAMFGDRAWWLPAWLDRLLPDLDVEGDKLVQRLSGEHGDVPEAAEPPGREPASARAG
ncbi:MMPL family transporter [Blastococcus sp. MG754426]|uniref:MMPL family transporter n=1 Tax=unclassified Blastococcus TaxID=2619396 RepID=UPI001EF06490|nr:MULTISPECIES: MMPL family transporter [unclassified Blastococcus]MCF6506395.1 MMPL family transporter [Blastococcus sp. MG754426]MCF6513058.1 MMPL family transporter [Blastococcus sp. MG754427]